MADGPGVWRRIRHRLGLVRRGIAVALGPDDGSVSGASGSPPPTARDPRLAGAPPELAEYVAAHEPVWFEYDADHAPPLSPLAGETVEAGPAGPAGPATAAADRVREAQRGDGPAPVPDGLDTAAPLGDVPSPPARPSRPRDLVAPPTDQGRPAAPARPAHVGFRRPLPRAAEPTASTAPPGPTADLAVPRAAPEAATHPAPDPAVTRSRTPEARELPMPRQQSAPPSWSDPDPRSRPVARRRPPTSVEQTEAASPRPVRPDDPRREQQPWPAPPPARHEPVAVGPERRVAADRLVEPVGAATPLAERRVVVGSAPWPELPEWVAVDQGPDEAWLDGDTWRADPLIEEQRVR